MANIQWISQAREEVSNLLVNSLQNLGRQNISSENLVPKAPSSLSSHRNHFSPQKDHNIVPKLNIQALNPQKRCDAAGSVCRYVCTRCGNCNDNGLSPPDSISVLSPNTPSFKSDTGMSPPVKPESLTTEPRSNKETDKFLLSDVTLAGGQKSSILKVEEYEDTKRVEQLGVIRICCVDPDEIDDLILELKTADKQPDNSIKIDLKEIIDEGSESSESSGASTKDQEGIAAFIRSENSPAQPNYNTATPPPQARDITLSSKAKGEATKKPSDVKVYKSSLKNPEDSSSTSTEHSSSTSSDSNYEEALVKSLKFRNSTRKVKSVTMSPDTIHQENSKENSRSRSRSSIQSRDMQYANRVRRGSLGFELRDSYTDPMPPPTYDSSGKKASKFKKWLARYSNTGKHKG